MRLDLIRKDPVFRVSVRHSLRLPYRTTVRLKVKKIWR